MGPSTKPAVDRGPGAVGHHIQQATLLQVDQAGHIAGGRQAGGLEEGGLVQAKRGHPVQAPGVLHQLGPVFVHPPHDGRPADPEVTGDRGDGVGVLADPPAGLGPGPFGQHRPRTDAGRLLGPGPDPTGRLPTAPEALAPPQHDRPAADRQVAHPDRAPAVRGGPHATACTADHRGRGLDGELPFAAHELGRDELEAVQVEQPGAGRTRVLTHLGPPSCRRQTSASYARPQVAFGSLRRRHGRLTTLHDEEPLIRHVRGMRSSSKSPRWPSHRRHVGDRSCPSDTEVDRLIWHAGGTVDSCGTVGG
jgi:hypothetical protein